MKTTNDSRFPIRSILTIGILLVSAASLAAATRTKANNTDFRLAASVWSEKTSKLFDVAHRMNAGVVWANGSNLFDPASAFGGVRHSGFGREGGPAGLLPYLEVL